jgi:virulence-associated protein VagC
MHMKTVAVAKPAKTSKISKPAKSVGNQKSVRGKKTDAVRRDGRLTAKVFQSGNSQAVRIPSSLRLEAKTYLVEPNASGGLTLIDPAHEARRLAALRELWGSSPDFPDHTT